MKKRARQSINSARLVHEQDLTDSHKSLKRPKNTHSVAPTLPSDPDNTHTSVFTLDPLTSLNDGTNNLQYQTPFNLSPVSSPTAPDPMSPVPPSRRQLSRTGSRNLKENKGIRHLASPFHSCSASKACSRSGSKTNSPKKKINKPPFYIKARTRSEANAHLGANVSDEVPFPVSGSLPTLGSMKAAVYGPHLADKSTDYMLQNLSGQDWLRPAKALSRSPFPEDYVPPGTPFQEWDLSSDSFLGGVPLQTSTPNVVKDPIRRHMFTDATLSAPNALGPTHTSDGANNNAVHPVNTFTLESRQCARQDSNLDSIFSSLDESTTLSSISLANDSNVESTLQVQGDSILSRACLPDAGQAVVNLSGMLNGLDIDGMFHSPRLLKSSVPQRRASPHRVHIVRSYSSLPSDYSCLQWLSTGTHVLHLAGLEHSALSLVQRSRSLDTRQTAGRRDRASTIRASDYAIKPPISVPGGGGTSMGVAALTTRTRSGTIRPVQPPAASSATSFPVAISQSCAGERRTQSGASFDHLRLVSSDKKSLGSPSSSQSKLVQMTRSSGVEATECMVIDAHNEESDDELLLDRKGWNWDGRWD
jgi:hypothetical protein